MSAARSFCVVCVNDAPAYRGECVFNKAAFVQRVGVNSDLNIVLVGGVKRGADNCGGGAPVLVDFKSARSRLNCSMRA